MEQLVNIMMQLLKSEFGQASLDDLAANPLSEDDLKKLYVLSKAHDLAHYVGFVLDKHHLLPCDTEIAKKFQKQAFVAVYRYEQLNYEYTLLRSLLEEAEIPFIPLKGSVIRKYYPEPWLRTSCDIDVLVHKNDLEKAVARLVENQGYELGERGTHDLSLFSKSGVHIELHFDLIEDARYPDAGRVLSDVWSHTQLEDGSRFCYSLSDEMFYFYHIAHMAKHFDNGGCGVRPFLDMWFLENQVPHNDEKRNQVLAQGGLLVFANAARKLTNVWFSDSESDEITDELQLFILRGGVFGTAENSVIVKQRKKGGKVKYIFSRLFLPYRLLKARYPILEKHRWMTPVFEVYRWFQMIFSGRMKNTVKEIKINQQTSKEQAQNVTDFLSKIGL